MGEYQYKLKCNKCWEIIQEYGYITACSHVFCENDAKEWFSNNPRCPACSKILNTYHILINSMN